MRGCGGGGDWAVNLFFEVWFSAMPTMTMMMSIRWDGTGTVHWSFQVGRVWYLDFGSSHEHAFLLRGEHDSSRLVYYRVWEKLSSRIVEKYKA